MLATFGVQVGFRFWGLVFALGLRGERLRMQACSLMSPLRGRAQFAGVKVLRPFRN